MFKMDFVKIIVLRCLWATKQLAAQNIVYALRNSKSVKLLRYMNQFFFLDCDFSLLESCLLYINAKYKASYCFKIKAVIQRCSVKKLLLKILQIHKNTPVPKSLYNKVVA